MLTLFNFTPSSSSDYLNESSPFAMASNPSKQLGKRLTTIKNRVRQTLSSSSCAVNPLHLIADELLNGLHLARVDLEMLANDGEPYVISNALPQEIKVLDKEQSGKGHISLLSWDDVVPKSQSAYAKKSRSKLNAWRFRFAKVCNLLAPALRLSFSRPESRISHRGS